MGRDGGVDLGGGPDSGGGPGTRGGAGGGSGAGQGGDRGQGAGRRAVAQAAAFAGGAGWRSILFPPEPRAFPGKRAAKITLRGLHVLAAGVLTGGVLLGAAHGAVVPWIWATLASGLSLLSVDLYSSGAFLLQVRGLVVATKLALLAAMPWFGAHRGWLLAGLIVLSVVSSHAPSTVRYFLLVGRGHIRADTSKG